MKTVPMRARSYGFVVANLVQAQSSMACRNGFSKLMAERVKHRMVRVHRWKTVPWKLFGHNTHKLLHSFIITTPVAY